MAHALCACALQHPHAACYYDRMTTRTFFKAAAWFLLAAILFVTVSPIGLRPSTITGVNLDRALAYALAACVFVLAYPRHWKIVALLFLMGTAGMEVLQYLSPSRHPHVSDAAVKAAGAATGIVCGWLVNEVRFRRAAARLATRG